MILLSRI